MAAILPLLQEAVLWSSLRRVASEAGVSHGALHKILEGGSAPYDRTLHKLEEWAKRKAVEDEPGSQRIGAREIIAVLSHTRAIGDLAPTARDRIGLAYRIALESELPPEEFRLLDSWRDALLGDEGDPGSGTQGTRTPKESES